MTRQDPQRMAYPQTYPPLAGPCECGHSVLVHFLSEITKKRTQCSVSYGGKCPCQQYVEGSDAD